MKNFLFIAALFCAALFSSCDDPYTRKIVDQTNVIMQQGESATIHTSPRATITADMTRNFNSDAHCFEITDIQAHEITVKATAVGKDSLRIDFEDSKSKLGYGAVFVQINVVE